MYLRVYLENTLLKMRAIGYEDGRNLAAFFNISFPLWMRQSHIVNTPRCESKRENNIASVPNYVVRLFSMLMTMVKPFLSENVANNVTFHSGDLTSLRKHFRSISIREAFNKTNSNLL